MLNIKITAQKNNIYIVIIFALLFIFILGYISYYELQREKNYLWELARVEGLNIAFSIQTLGSEFILDRDILLEVLDLFQKEGITFIDVVDRGGSVRLSTSEQRVNHNIKINYPGTINYLQTVGVDNQRILQIIKPFDFDDRFSSDLFGYLFLRDKYLLIGINMESYYARYDQIKQRIFFNYLVILIMLLFGIYTIFKLQENLVVKRTLQNIQDYTTKLLENMDSGVISVDENNIIRTFNQKSEQIFQLTRSEVLGEDAEKVLPIKILGTSLYQLGLLEKKKIEQEIELKTNSSSKKILEINTSLLTGENGKNNGMVILVRDISQIKKLAEEINRNKRLTSLGKLSSGIAHEIRNPLSSIRGLTQFLQQSFAENDERKNDARIILQETDRLNQLVTQILDYSRPKKLSINDFVLAEMLDELIHLLQSEEKNKEISFQLKEKQKSIHLEGDQDQLKQAFLNIIINSTQSINGKGDIIISLDKQLIEEKEMVYVTIKDNGIGIASHDLVHIFDPFFTSKENGYGLGLSIAYNIIETHQGSIKVESEKGAGTKIEIILPARSTRNE
ncbi:MAG: ATP-binding protein [Atribacterota bacterium]|nr:ATP-binding protein [Atribacterota bacterium]